MEQTLRHGRALAILAAASVPFLMLPIPRTLPVDYIPETSVPQISDLAPNAAVDIAPYTTVIYNDTLEGAESVAVDGEGRLYIPDKYGVLWRSAATAFPYGPLEHVSFLGGRPLGCIFTAQGGLLIANAGIGLMALGKAWGNKPLLLTAGEDKPAGKSKPSPIYYANGVEVVDDVVYITDSDAWPPLAPIQASAPWDSLSAFVLNVFTGSTRGRVLGYNSSSKTTRELASGLWFADGIAASANKSFLLVAETNGARLYRYWLTGQKAGSLELFVASLPGPPDGISLASDGNFWVTIAGVPRLGWVLTLSARVPIIRFLTGWAITLLPPDTIPTTLELFAAPPGLIVKVSAKDGSVIRALRDSTGSILQGYFSSAIERNGKLIIGSINGRGIALVDLKAAGAL